MWRIAENILNKQSWIASKNWSSSLCTVRENSLLENITQALDLAKLKYFGNNDNKSK
jgi:hypothetical protein